MARDNHWTKSGPLVMLMLCGGVQAQELYCEGVTFVGSEEVKISTVIKWDPKTLSVTLGTNAGEASGTMQETPKLYMGTLVTGSGVNYWFNLDRFTGALIYGQSKPDETMAQVEFTGTCAKRERLF